MRIIFATPLVIAGLILFGLLSALLGQGGVWFWLSWIALTTPIAVAARFGIWPSGSSAEPPVAPPSRPLANTDACVRPEAAAGD